MVGGRVNSFDVTQSEGLEQDFGEVQIRLGSAGRSSLLGSLLDGSSLRDSFLYRFGSIFFRSLILLFGERAVLEREERSRDTSSSGGHELVESTGVECSNVVGDHIYRL